MKYSIIHFSCTIYLFTVCCFIRYHSHTKESTFHSFKTYSHFPIHLEHSCGWCWNLKLQKVRSEMPRKFWNVVLEKDR